MSSLKSRPNTPDIHPFCTPTEEGGSTRQLEGLSVGGSAAAKGFSIFKGELLRDTTLLEGETMTGFQLGLLIEQQNIGVVFFSNADQGIVHSSICESKRSCFQLKMILDIPYFGTEVPARPD